MTIAQDQTAEQSATRWAVTVTRTRQVEEQMTFVGTMPSVDELVGADQTPIEWVGANYLDEGSVEQGWEESSSEQIGDLTALVEVLNDGGDVLDKTVLA